MGPSADTDRSLHDDTLALEALLTTGNGPPVAMGEMVFFIHYRINQISVLIERVPCKAEN